MNLYFTGHGEKYAVEQTLLTLFPQERPVYPDTPPGGDNELELSFSRGRPGATARATLRREGRTYTRQCRVQTSQLPQDDPVVATRLTRRTLQRAFYLAAVDCLGAEPPWGMLSGVRPVKLPTRAMEAGATPRQAERMLRDRYHVSPLRRQLAMDCAQASLAVKGALKPEEISLYVGIPFCPTRCAYCSSSPPRVGQPADPRLPGRPARGDRRRRGGRPPGGEDRPGGVHRGRHPHHPGGRPAGPPAGAGGHGLRLAPGTECTVEAGRPDTITREKLLPSGPGAATGSP